MLATMTVDSRGVWAHRRPGDRTRSGSPINVPRPGPPALNHVRHLVGAACRCQSQRLHGLVHLLSISPIYAVQVSYQIIRGPNCRTISPNRIPVVRIDNVYSVKRRSGRAASTKNCRPRQHSSGKHSFPYCSFCHSVISTLLLLRHGITWLTKSYALVVLAWLPLFTTWAFAHYRRKNAVRVCERSRTKPHVLCAGQGVSAVAS